MLFFMPGNTTAMRQVLRTVRSQKPVLVRNALRGERKEPLSCREAGNFKWYSCGPTVYDDAHLGHARAYVSFDIIRRIVSALTGSHIDYALGVTDIDDKIIQRASQTNTTPTAVASHFEKRFFEDMCLLNVLPPSKILRVTEHIRELQRFTSDLIDSDAAYISDNGNVYFSVRCSGERYGQLDPSRGISMDNVALPTGATEHLDKRDPRDFALWKRTNSNAPTDGGVWDSPWGAGRPGWHIECSAMAMSAVGSYLDLHTGGIDLRFPHHTNELATAEAKLRLHKLPASAQGTTERWSHTWLHAGHLHQEGRKMSKSLKNFVTVREFMEKGGSADAFRIFCLLHRYSSPVEYSADRLTDAQAYLSRIRRFLDRDTWCSASQEHLACIGEMSMHPGCDKASEMNTAIRKAEDDIEDALADDFDTPRALSQISKLISAGNASVSSTGEWVSGTAALTYSAACTAVKRTLGMLGISEDTLSQGSTTAAVEPHDVGEIITAYVKFRSGIREAAKRKDLGAIFELCDGARDETWNKFGIRIADQKDGASTWSRA